MTCYQKALLSLREKAVMAAVFKKHCKCVSNYDEQIVFSALYNKKSNLAAKPDEFLKASQVSWCRKSGCRESFSWCSLAVPSEAKHSHRAGRAGASTARTHPMASKR